MKSLAKIASRFNLIALIFQNFPVGACPQTPLEGVHFAHCLCTKSNNIFHCHSFQWAPLKFYALLRPCSVKNICKEIFGFCLTKVYNITSEDIYG